MAHVRTAIPKPDDPVHCLAKDCPWSGTYCEVSGQYGSLAQCPRCGHVVARGEKELRATGTDDLKLTGEDIHRTRQTIDQAPTPPSTLEDVLGDLVDAIIRKLEDVQQLQAGRGSNMEPVCTVAEHVQKLADKKPTPEEQAFLDAHDRLEQRWAEELGRIHS